MAGRPAERPAHSSTRMVADALRQRLRDGTYPPGSRLPTHRALVVELRTSPVTLQRAFDLLVNQGYVTTVAKHGTFVAERLPDRFCHALVVGHQPSGLIDNRFWSTLVREAHGWSDGQDRRFDCYFVGGQEGPTADQKRLDNDVADGRLAGVVFANAPYYLLAPQPSSLLAATLPRVCFGGRSDDVETYRASILVPGDEEIIEDIFRWFASEKRKRVAAITTLPRGGRWRSHLPALHRAGLETRDSWWIGFPPFNEVAEAVRGCARLMFERRPSERPDALLIDDDNLVPWVTAGIAQAGIAVPSELSIAAHANVPGPTPAAVPCRRYGFDARELLTAAIAEIGRLGQGQAPRLLPQPARFLDNGTHPGR